MRLRPFQQVDVFTDTPYRGNPLAVVLEAQGLDDEAMQRFARWINLSETAFVLPPTDEAADYRVRIFTPAEELAFAGHPTLGSCHAWLRAGGQPRAPRQVVQQCGVGLVTLRRGDTDSVDRLAFAAPPLRRSAPSPTLLARVAQALGLRADQIAAAQALDNGLPWLGLLLVDDAAVLALQPDHRALRALGHNVGVAGLTAESVEAPALIGRSNREARAFGHGAAATTRPTTGVHLEVRAFPTEAEVAEDPVTGSLNACLAQWLIADGHLPERYTAGQGQCLDRDGRIRIERDAQGQVWVGGDAVTCIDGQVLL